MTDDTLDAAPPDALDAGALAQLARKYEALAALRRARARGEPIPGREVFRALAREFPGALSELDNLPLDEIDRRLEALRSAPPGPQRDRWIPWMHRYHALMRAALYLKLRVARRAPLSEAGADDLAARAAAHARTPIDRAFVFSVQAPPAGRLNHVVFGRLSAIFATPEDELRSALFPKRSPRR